VHLREVFTLTPHSSSGGVAARGLTLVPLSWPSLVGEGEVLGTPSLPPFGSQSQQFAIGSHFLADLLAGRPLGVRESALHESWVAQRELSNGGLRFVSRP
jgi:hypothetical protein